MGKVAWGPQFKRGIFFPLFPQMDLGIPAMTKCCNQLDACYDTCGANKYRCDAKFRWCLHSICSDLKRSLGFVSNVASRCLKGICLWAGSLFLFSHRYAARAPLLTEAIKAPWTFGNTEQCTGRGEGHSWLKFPLSCAGAAGATPDGERHTNAFPEI